jgi:5-methylcytosine-specific restriction protein A
LLTWNPKRAPWESLVQDARRSAAGGVIEMKWSSGNTKRILPNDRIFIMRLGVEPCGLIAASGWITAPPQLDRHWDEQKAVNGDRTRALRFNDRSRY